MKCFYHYPMIFQKHAIPKDWIDATSVGLGYLYFDTGINYMQLGSKGLATVDSFCKSKSPNSHVVEIFNQKQQSFLAQKAAEVATSTWKTRDWWIGLQKSGKSWIWHSSSKTASYTDWSGGEPKSSSHEYAFLETSYKFSWRSATDTFGGIWPLCQVNPNAIKVSCFTYLQITMYLSFYFAWF